MPLLNKQVVLAARPVGFPKESDFRLVETPVPALSAGDVLIRVIYLSVDPYMRGRMSAAKSYAKPVEIGGVMTGGAVGEVIDSKNAVFKAGDFVVGDLGWQEYAVSNGTYLRKIDPAAASLSTALGVLGMTGLTAYFGLLTVGELKAGEQVIVSGAAGAVGSIAGQIAKLHGCYVAGIAGTEEKIQYITRELGFDVAFNYKTEEDYQAKLQQLCPDGFDIYFDNVGGRVTDAVIPLLNLHGRVAVCGQISQYNLEKPETGPRWMPQLIIKRAKVEGFLVTDFAERFPQALEELAAWYRAGRLKFPEQIERGGIERAPAAFIGMLRGNNIGKQLVQVSETATTGK